MGIGSRPRSFLNELNTPLFAMDGWMTARFCFPAGFHFEIFLKCMSGSFFGGREDLFEQIDPEYKLSNMELTRL